MNKTCTWNIRLGNEEDDIPDNKEALKNCAFQETLFIALQEGRLNC